MFVKDFNVAEIYDKLRAWDSQLNRKAANGYGLSHNCYYFKLDSALPNIMRKISYMPKYWLQFTINFQESKPQIILCKVLV